MKMSLQKDATLRVVASKSPYYFAVWTHGPDRNYLSPPSDVTINGRSYNANRVFISINSTYIVVSYLRITVLRSNETYALWLSGLSNNPPKTLNPTAMNNHGSPQICAKLS